MYLIIYFEIYLCPISLQKDFETVYKKKRRPDMIHKKS